MSAIHIVSKGDTLTKISKIHGVSITDLKTINQLANPNKLEIGQKIRLRKEDVLGFQALILDRDRNPIVGQAYQFEFAGRMIKGITGMDGLTQKVMTTSPEDRVRILIERLDSSLKEVATVLSGFGNKLVTLVSPRIKVGSKTEKHPETKPGLLPNKHEKPDPIHNPKAKQAPTTDKKELGPKVSPTKTPDGKPLAKVEGDVMDLDFLGEYIGGEITKADIEKAASELKCEPGLIYAVAKQESAHSSFIKIGNRTVPTILFERHQFAKYSNHAFDKINPDISGSAYKRAKKTKNGDWIEKKSGKKISENDIYGPSGIFQYKRLVKAYRLNQNAALKACSWGKFQIMGFNYQTTGFTDVKAFVKAMSMHDGEHMKAFLKFVKTNKTLLDGLQNRDFEKIAKGHNGEFWESINPEYANNIEKFYNEYPLLK